MIPEKHPFPNLSKICHKPVIFSWFLALMFLLILLLPLLKLLFHSFLFIYQSLSFFFSSFQLLFCLFVIHLSCDRCGSQQTLQLLPQGCALLSAFAKFLHIKNRKSQSCSCQAKLYFDSFTVVCTVEIIKPVYYLLPVSQILSFPCPDCLLPLPAPKSFLFPSQVPLYT